MKPIQRRTFLASLTATHLVWGQEDHTGGDPLGSMQYPGLREQTIGGAQAAFSNSVVIQGPPFADDAMNVPLLVDARGLAQVGGGVRRIRVAVDRNPVRQVLDFEPRLALPILAFRIRMEQASPVRAFVQTRDNQWHVGSAWIQAAGGGCTVPGLTRTDGSWSKTLGQVHARFFYNVIENSRRLRLRIMHPMDTGLVAGIPAFFIEQLELQGPDGQVWWRIELHEPVSENPILTFELPPNAPPNFRLLGTDNNGNRIRAEVMS